MNRTIGLLLVLALVLIYGPRGRQHMLPIERFETRYEYLDNDAPKQCSNYLEPQDIYRHTLELKDRNHKVIYNPVKDDPFALEAKLWPQLTSRCGNIKVDFSQLVK